MPNSFIITKKSKLSKARSGIINTSHGQIKTPCFMPDATRAAVKTLSQDDLRALQLPAVVVNTYHLYLQPGSNLIKQAGGAHKFMNWPGPILSDSGGYQVFSLIHKNRANGKIMEDKVIFKSPLDGSRHELSPAKSIKIQFDLGCDIIVCLDDCPPNDFNDIMLTGAVERTIDWANQCQAEYNKQLKLRKITSAARPLLFSVIQGGAYLALRRRCAQALVNLNFDGYGFGARPVDPSGRFLKKVLDYTADLIPEKSPRFGLGIGLPEDIVRCVSLGWDMFDCVIPTREGRHGRLFYFNNQQAPEDFLSKAGKSAKNFYFTVNINNAKFTKDFSPINASSGLAELREHSKAYLHHLFKIHEPSAQRLASLNNLEFYITLLNKIQQLIGEGKF